MATLPVNATPEQIEDEIVFVGVQIDTLDPDADDFEHSLTVLRTQQDRLQSLLEASLQQPGHSGPATSAPSKPLLRRDAWWQAATGNTREGPNTSSSDDGSSTTLSSQDDPLPSSSKRPRSQSNWQGASPVSKRPARNLEFPGAPRFTSSSNDLVERAKRRHEAAEAALRRQQDLQRSDADFARQMSQGYASTAPSGSASTSHQPHTQATLSFDGGFHRLPSIKPDPVPELVTQLSIPPKQQPNAASNRLANLNSALQGSSKRPVGADDLKVVPWQPRFQQPPPLPHNVQHGNQGRSLPWTSTRPALHVKNESSPSRYQQLFNTPRQTAPVVDLTASDSDEDVKEVFPSEVQPHHNVSGPSHSTMPRVPSGHVFTPQIPGAYPGTPPIYSVPHQSPSATQYYSPHLHERLMQVRNAHRGMGPGPSMPTQDLGYLLNGRTSGGMYNMDDNDYDDDDDGDGVYFTGSRHLPYGSYAGKEDLYRSRYTALAAYDATKSDEEIQKLLQNIRPDEEMPEHLCVKTPESMTISLHKYQEAGLTWLQECEKGSNKGGILADDMGLGKTIQMLSLLVTHKSQEACKTTLIVAPVALMRQWQQEIQQKIKPGRHSLTVYIHHGSAKKKHFRDLQHYDVVLTTFGSLAVEVKKMEALRLRRQHDPSAQPGPKERCALLGNDARWYRIILDEAQCIKNKATKTAKGACMVNAKFRWCMTGTPMMNSVEELYSLINFLQIKPYSQWEKFRMDLKIPLKSADPNIRGTAMRRLQTLCKAIMLRRTKKSEYMNRPILILPERTTEIDSPEFSEDETSFYQALETKSQLQFNKYLRRGTIRSSYSAILVLLLRLRQACCHPHLIKDFGVSVAADVTEDQMLEMAQLLSEPVVARIKELNGTFECPVCYDVTPNPAIFIPCGHDTCSECFAKLTDPAQAIQRGEEGGAQFKCPNCRGPIDPKRLTDFASFKKIHAPEMLTEQEAAELAAEADEDTSDAESDDSSTESDQDSSDGDSDDSKGSLRDFIVDDNEEEEEEQDVKPGKHKRAIARLDDDKIKGEDEDDEDSDDLDNGVKAENTVKSSLKRELIEDDMTGQSDAGAMADSKSGEETGKLSKKRTRKLKSNGKGKGKGKAKEKEEKEKKKKVKAVMTLAELKKRANRNQASRKQYLRRVRKDWVSSAKIDKTMEILREVMESEEREKVLIFSQWTSLLDLLEVPIDDCGYGYRRYDGSMNAGMRGDAVDDFRDERKNVRIMLVSLKAGNAGLNLNMASQVILLDPFWNPYIEEQAIDRAHRIGQLRPVKVHRVLIENTVEDRIIELQEKKRALISEALDEKASQSISRLGVQELAYLFGVTRDLSEQVNYAEGSRRG